MWPASRSSSWVTSTPTDRRRRSRSSSRPASPNWRREYEPTSATYQFSGRLGSLDHVFANQSALSLVTGAACGTSTRTSRCHAVLAAQLQRHRLLHDLAVRLVRPRPGGRRTPGAGAQPEVAGGGLLPWAPGTIRGATVGVTMTMKPSDRSYSVNRTDESGASTCPPTSSRCSAERAPNAPSPVSTPTQQDRRRLRVPGLRSRVFASRTKFDSHCGWPSLLLPWPVTRSEFLEDRSCPAGRASRCAVRPAARTWVTSSRARATAPRPTSATASARSASPCARPTAGVPEVDAGRLASALARDQVRDGHAGARDDGVSSRTCRRARVARMSRMRSTIRCRSSASKARIHSVVVQPEGRDRVGSHVRIGSRRLPCSARIVRRSVSPSDTSRGTALNGYTQM